MKRVDKLFRPINVTNQMKKKKSTEKEGSRAKKNVVKKSENVVVVATSAVAPNSERAATLSRQFMGQ